MTEAGNDKSRDSVIDQSLRRVYEEALDEGIPDRFKDLLDKLKQQENEESSEK